jgi:hypothetical protein
MGEMGKMWILINLNNFRILIILNNHNNNKNKQ